MLVRSRIILIALAFVAVGLAAALTAAAAPVPIAAATQLRGHLPELGARPSIRLFQTANAYEMFRASLSDPSFLPPVTRLFMSFDRDVLVLYARGDDSGGRCLRSGSTASVDGDTVTLDLVWEGGTCGAPASARHPFVMVSLARTASDGSAWVQPTRSVCGGPPGVDRVCASVGGGTSASPAPTPQPTAAPSPSAAVTAGATPTSSPVATTAPPTASPSPAPTTAVPATAPTTVAPTVALASPPARSPDPTPRLVEVPADDTVNYLLWGALGLIILFVIAAGLFGRSPRR